MKEKNPEITDEFIRNKISSGKNYCLRLLKAGPNRDQTAEEAGRIQMEHLRYVMKLRNEGIILLNGPVIKEHELRSIAIFNTTDKENVKRLSDEDPAVKAARLVYEIYDWFGLPGDNLI